MRTWQAAWGYKQPKRVWGQVKRPRHHVRELFLGGPITQILTSAPRGKHSEALQNQNQIGQAASGLRRLHPTFHVFPASQSLTTPNTFF